MNTERPKRGEIWLVSFDPTIGSEIRKSRPAVVISSDSIGVLPLKLACPVTEWREDFRHLIWQVKVVPTEKNGLKKPSSIDVLQTRCLDLRRFGRRLGVITEGQMKDVCLALSEITESGF
ncbi:MAG: type II toxin-antitoxin system PemK/MazF family toxin [Candidatus Riflebacteria bacterium]|nr:type II toxin-antitoxin system PemK/MazF family toxin [Candidatus Riflebacteria bacterium]